MPTMKHEAHGRCRNCGAAAHRYPSGWQHVMADTAVTGSHCTIDPEPTCCAAHGAHKASWFVYAGTERIPRTSSMRGLWGYDVVCSCGWDSRTGGATERSVRESLARHRRDVELDAKIAAAAAR